MKFIEKLLDDVGLRVQRRTCKKCHYSKDIIYPDQQKEWWPLGCRCGTCGGSIWFPAKSSTLLKDLSSRPDDVPNHGAMYEAWAGQVERAFLKSLPPCPDCQTTNFVALIEPGEETKEFACGSCGTGEKHSQSQTLDVLSEYRAERVWYLRNN